MTGPNDCSRLLIAIASQLEANACGLRSLPLWESVACADHADVVRTGVSKASAAGGVATALRLEHCGVVSLGIGGELPGAGLPIRTWTVAEASTFADDGIETPTGYQSCAELGFPALDGGDEVAGDPTWVRRLVAAGATPVRVATVSTCSGTDARAAEVARRTGARVEAMEGAAAGLVAVRRGVRFVELRVVSNTTGDRERQVWDMRGALAELGEAFRMLVRELGEDRES